MFRDLIPALADRFHIVAPDLPGFGNSDMPDKGNTFDRIAETIDRFTETVGFDRYAVYVFDYGAPTGFRLAVKHPDRITAIISQNGNAYEEGLSDGWNPIRAYWKDASPANRAALRDFLKPESTYWQYTHGVSDTTKVSPDGYSLDNFYLARPGVTEVQLDLFGDYKSNVALYPTFQQYFRTHKPPLAGGVGQERSVLPAAGRGGVQARHPERDGALLRHRTFRAGDARSPRSRRPSAISFPADLHFAIDGETRNGEVSRHRHGREPGHRPGDGHPPCARLLGARPRRAGPRQSGRDGGGGEGRRRRSAGDRYRPCPSPRPPRP